ncbi:GNAT family N-acetyltransferase [Fusibacter bizertensis]
MKIVNCMEVEDQDIFNAFKLGFSDYAIPFDMDLHTFINRFFHVEANRKEYSFIAFDDEHPVGIVLGGINDYDGIKTLRCGALSIAPDYRGKGISQELMLAHESIATMEKCKQLMLEVLYENNRAIHFYEKLGYLRTYNLFYYTLLKNDFVNYREEHGAYSPPLSISADDLICLKDNMTDIHINWQNDFHYIDKIVHMNYYGIYEGTDYISNHLVAFVAVDDKAKIYRIFTHPKHRGKNLGKTLIEHVFTNHDFERITFSSPANSPISTFLQSIGFNKEKRSQYEMTKPLK